MTLPAQSLYSNKPNCHKTQEYPSSSSWPALPSIDISLLDPNVLNQVRSEYLAQQQTSNASVMPVNTQNETVQADDDSIIESAKSITPEVLMRLSRLAKETDLLPTLRRMQQEQVSAQSFGGALRRGSSIVLERLKPHSISIQ